MRDEQQSLALPQQTADFIFHFQITSMGARHACSVKVRATSRGEAASFFRDRRVTIEKLARENLAKAKLMRFDATAPTRAGTRRRGSFPARLTALQRERRSCNHLEGERKSLRSDRAADSGPQTDFGSGEDRKGEPEMGEDQVPMTRHSSLSHRRRAGTARPAQHVPAPASGCGRGRRTRGTASAGLPSCGTLYAPG